MKKLTAKEAYALLIDGIIDDEKDLEREKNKWIRHCLYVGMAAERIAQKLNIDSDWAKALGYVHDIGRRIDHFNHPLEGYKYMCAKGYVDEARVCLTHSFIDNDISLTAGGGPKRRETYDFINDYLEKHPYDIYDNIIQMCDLFCSENGFTTVEHRLLDITERKGAYPNSYEHYQKMLELQNRLEQKMHCSLYDLFPEIGEDKILDIPTINKELLNLIKNPQKIKRMDIYEKNLEKC